MRRVTLFACLLSALGPFAETTTLGMNPQQLFEGGMNALTGTGPSGATCRRSIISAVPQI